MASNVPARATAVVDMRLPRLSNGTLTTHFTGFLNGDSTACVFLSGTALNFGLAFRGGELYVSDPVEQANCKLAAGQFPPVAGKPGEAGSTD